MGIKRMEEDKEGDFVSATLAKADLYIKKLKLPLPEKPINLIKWPENLNDLRETELSELLTRLSGWQAYAGYQLAREETNKENLTESYDLKLKQATYNSKKDFDTVTETKAAISQMSDMVDLKKKIQFARAKVKLLSGLIAGYESKYAATSREISRRKSEVINHG